MSGTSSGSASGVLCYVSNCVAHESTFHRSAQLSAFVKSNNLENMLELLLAKSLHEFLQGLTTLRRDDRSETNVGKMIVNVREDFLQMGEKIVF